MRLKIEQIMLNKTYQWVITMLQGKCQIKGVKFSCCSRYIQ